MSVKQKVSVGLLSFFIFLVIAYICIIAFSHMPEQRLKRQLSLGEKYLSEMNYEDAILAYERAILIDSKSVDAYVGLANAYIGLEDYDMANDIVEYGIGLIGERKTLLNLLDDIQEELNRFQEVSSSQIESHSTNEATDSELSTESPQEINSQDMQPIAEESEESEENYDVPSVLAALSERDGRYYINNDELWVVYSYGTVEDKGTYYEISDVVLSFYDNSNTDPDADFPQTNEGYEPFVFRIRKDAKVWLPSPEESTTAEEYYMKNGFFAPEQDRQYNDNEMMYSTGEGFKVDEEGYIIEFTAFPFG